MQEPVKTIDYRGYEIEVRRDLDALDPRNMQTLSKMMCSHGRYELGDEEIPESVINQHGSWDEITDWIEENEEGEMLTGLPLYLIDHSGIAMQTKPFRCDPGGWDSGMVGWIYTTKEMLGEVGVEDHSRDNARKILRKEVERYSQYLEGKVYMANLRSPEGETFHRVVWGPFYGTDFEENGLLEQCRDHIDVEIKSRKEKRWEKIKALIDNNVSLDKRQTILQQVPIK